jgi:hypothetical protein
MKNKSLKKQLEELSPGDLVQVDWTDASIGRGLGGIGVDIPVSSWGIYIGLLGKQREHIILAQNAWHFSDGLCDIDLTAIPTAWGMSVKVIEKNYVKLEEAQVMRNSFLAGTRKMKLGRGLRQEKILNHEGLG